MQMKHGCSITKLVLFKIHHEFYFSGTFSGHLTLEYSA